MRSGKWLPPIAGAVPPDLQFEHFVEEGSPPWRDYLAFRDYLRAHPVAARQFGDLRTAPAARFPQDREAYINGKAESVRRILQLAIGVA